VRDENKSGPYARGATAAMDAYRSAGADPEGLVRLARQRGWRAEIIHQRTGVDHDTIARVLSEAE
jgi:hypothetical protein